MSTEDHEQRLAALQKTLLSTHGLITTMFVTVARLADDQNKLNLAILESMFKSEEKNEALFSLISSAIPDEDFRQEIKQVLNRSSFNRDQFEAAIEAIKKMPMPSAVLESQLSSLQPPPAPPGKS